MRELIKPTDDRKAKIQKWVTDNILIPRNALVLFKNSDEPKRSAAAIELFDIANGGRLVNGRPINMQALGEFISAAQYSIKKKRGAQTYLSGFIDPSLLYVSQSTVAFLHPEGERSIFIGDEKNFKEIKMFLPAMVFVYKTKKELWAYWSTTNEHSSILGGEKVLLPAPMPNINGYGSVCIGTSMKKAVGKDIQSIRDYVIASFFGSAFNEWREGHAKDAVKYCIDQLGKNATNATFWKKAKKEKWNKVNQFISIKSALQ